jgi:heme-degrading monooxygenase HmoA
MPTTSNLREFSGCSQALPRLIEEAESAQSRRVSMAVAVQLEFKDATIEQYEDINERLGSLPGGPAAPQELFHWVTKTDEGFRVVDVWETREDFENFAREKLSPIYQEVGITHPPETQFFEVYNYLAGGRWRG